jgi:hypothetical protein
VLPFNAADAETPLEQCEKEMETYRFLPSFFLFLATDPTSAVKLKLLIICSLLGSF